MAHTNEAGETTGEKTYELTKKDLQRIYWHASRVATNHGSSIDGVDILNVLHDRLGTAETAFLTNSTHEAVLNEKLYEDEELARNQREELLVRINEQHTE